MRVPHSPILYFQLHIKDLREKSVLARLSLSWLHTLDIRLTVVIFLWVINSQEMFFTPKWKCYRQQYALCIEYFENIEIFLSGSSTAQWGSTSSQWTRRRPTQRGPRASPASHLNRQFLPRWQRTTEYFWNLFLKHQFKIPLQSDAFSSCALLSVPAL